MVPVVSESTSGDPVSWLLIRAGWKATTLKPGDKVTVKVFPLRDGDPGGLFQSVTLASGEVLTERAAAARTP